MVKKLLACTLLTILGLSLTSAVGGPEPLPQDLRTETLLVLLFDRAPDNLRGAKKHNELIDELNRKTLEELKKYPYPSATMARSKYEKNEDVPEHRYMLNGIIAKKFNDGEIVTTSDRAYVSDVVLEDHRTETTYIIFKDKPSTQHIFTKYALNEIVKRVEKGK